jgi:SpoVK/Ycf46/Vps4 family AAA+-type ATPase
MNSPGFKALTAAMPAAEVWLQAMAKGLAASAEGDAGVSERIRGTFLRWMQDRPAGTFLIATCNDPLALPAEFLRRGRFDEIFFVDLPGEAERAQIFALHLTRRERDPAAFDTAGLAAQTEGFSGAEIEAVVVGALYRAFAANTDLTQAALQEETAATIPLSRSRAEDISRLRVWAKSRTVPA